MRGTTMHERPSLVSRTLHSEGPSLPERRARNATAEMPPEIIHAMELVLAYLWDDERNNFLADPTTDHVFLKMLAVRGWLGLARGRRENRHG
jgi:hypothetical protein